MDLGMYICWYRCRVVRFLGVRVERPQVLKEFFLPSLSTFFPDLRVCSLPFFSSLAAFVLLNPCTMLQQTKRKDLKCTVIFQVSCMNLS